MGVRLAAAHIAAFFTIAAGFSASAAPTSVLGPDSNLPVPRFVSLKTEGANGRHGPGLEHKVDWIYERVGLPLQVTAESGPWRRVRDPDGAEVWMHAQNLEPRRMAFVTDAADAALRRDPNDHSRIVAYLEKGVVGALTACDGEWRRVAVAGRVGWVKQDQVWGASDCSGL
ncbi:MAG: SH3 domain-containing protein [Hyphomonadaceae bacterium]|nr:SH3 domain-containing protein [Hyphomonadaceae bacterium]